MYRYITVAADAKAEIVVEKSRFIAHIRPVRSKAEADGFFQSVRETHKTATHNVPAFVTGEKMEHQWASDDGEPQGTSGVPMLKLFVSEGVTNVAIVVTRYFGGIKLGTGGLVRAYTAAAKAALDASGKVEVRDGIRLGFEIEYSIYDRLRFLAEQKGYGVEDVEYGEKIRLVLTAESQEREEIIATLAGLTSNRAPLRFQEDREIFIPVD